MRIPSSAICLALTACMIDAAAYGGELRYAGTPSQLSVEVVSDRTVKIVIAPLDERGEARPVPPSTALLPIKTQLKLSTKELKQAQEISAGKLVVKLKREPLTATIRGPGDRPVQELTFDAADGSVAFRTDAPVLGLGEGGPAFDRRGHYYPMLNGQRARSWQRTVGRSRSRFLSVRMAGRCSLPAHGASSIYATAGQNSSRGRMHGAKNPCGFSS